MKEITEKANKLKELESLKEAKKIQKERLAKKYDEMIEKQKVVREDLKGPPTLAEEVKPKVEEVKPKVEEVKPKVEEVEEVKPKVKEVKPKKEVKPIKKKKVIKKIVYQEASSSDSDGADEVEVVKVKKLSKKK